MDKPRYRDSNRHALERAKQRYGVDFTDDDLDAMIAMIQSGRARYSGADWPTNSYWYVDYKDQTFRIVYNGREKRICTFLPNTVYESPKKAEQKADTHDLAHIA